MVQSSKRKKTTEDWFYLCVSSSIAGINPPFLVWELDEFFLMPERSETTIPKPPVSSSFFCGDSLFVSVFTSSFASIGSCLCLTCFCYLTVIVASLFFSIF